MELANNKNETADLTRFIRGFETARNHRMNWESHWQECYDFALPQRGTITRSFIPGGKRINSLYDATAMDSVDQLAASLLGHLTPPWSQWFGFKPGPDLNEAEAQAIAPLLEKAAKTIQAHFDRSNFAVEIHQCFLDLAVGGTSTLYFEETAPGSDSAFKFSAVPLSDIVLEEGEHGFLDTSYRQLSLNLSKLFVRYPDAELPLSILRQGDQNPDHKFDVLEGVIPNKGVYEFIAVFADDANPVLLKRGRFDTSPAISFR